MRRARKTAITLGVRHPIVAGGRDPTEDRRTGEAERLFRGQVVAIQRRLPRRRLVPGRYPGDRAADGQGRRHLDPDRRDRGTVRDREMVLHRSRRRHRIRRRRRHHRPRHGQPAPRRRRPGRRPPDEPAPVVRDLLDDIATVLGVDRWDAEKVPAADIPARLRTLAPDWAPYRTINGLEIRRYLDDRARGQGGHHRAQVSRSTRPRSATPSPAATPAATRPATGHDPAGRMTRLCRRRQE